MVKNYFTNSINFIHENNTWLMISGIIKHLTNQTSTLSNVLVHNSTRYNLKKVLSIKSS